MDDDEIFDSREIFEMFQNSFADLQQQPVCVCKHPNTYIGEAGQRICPECGLVFETVLDFGNECNWYKSDQSRCSRCSRRLHPKPKRCVQRMFEKMKSKYPP